MIDQQNINRLISERDHLMDSLAEQIRLGNIASPEIKNIISEIYDQYEQSVDVLRTFPDADIQDVITAFRGLITKSFNL